MTRFGLWIFMSKITHDFWLCWKLYRVWAGIDRHWKLYRVWAGIDRHWKLYRVWAGIDRHWKLYRVWAGIDRHWKLYRVWAGIDRHWSSFFYLYNIFKIRCLFYIFQNNSLAIQMYKKHLNLIRLVLMVNNHAQCCYHSNIWVFFFPSWWLTDYRQNTRCCFYWWHHYCFIVVKIFYTDTKFRTLYYKEGI